ncbi:MAG: hypothetical protein Q7S31_03715 [bacterium]|nr:hypothetical protein [bacterium]
MSSIHEGEPTNPEEVLHLPITPHRPQGDDLSAQVLSYLSAAHQGIKPGADYTNDREASEEGLEEEEKGKWRV